MAAVPAVSLSLSLSPSIPPAPALVSSSSSFFCVFRPVLLLSFLKLVLLCVRHLLFIFCVMSIFTEHSVLSSYLLQRKKEKKKNVWDKEMPGCSVRLLFNASHIFKVFPHTIRPVHPMQQYWQSLLHSYSGVTLQSLNKYKNTSLSHDSYSLKARDAEAHYFMLRRSDGEMSTGLQCGRSVAPCVWLLKKARLCSCQFHCIDLKGTRRQWAWAKPRATQWSDHRKKDTDTHTLIHTLTQQHAGGQISGAGLGDGTLCKMLRW